MSQRSDILAALQHGDRLTALDCWARFRCKDPAKTIQRLRRAGHKIPSAKFYTENGHRFGVWQMDEDSCDVA